MAQSYDPTPSQANLNKLHIANNATTGVSIYLNIAKEVSTANLGRYFVINAEQEGIDHFY